jgi:nicotinate dehydrogenase subunit A
MSQMTLLVNGRTHTVDVDPATPLLFVLSDDLALKGPKFGCGLAQCGACTVIVNGAATRSCVIPVSALDGATVRTLDGLGTPEKPHPVQAAFIAEEAAQCGYCTNGWIMTAVAGLERNPHVSDAEIRAMLAGLKCRCGTHMAILRAVRRAADTLASSDGNGNTGAGA